MKSIALGTLICMMLAAFTDEDTLLRIGSSTVKMKESAYYSIQQEQFNLFSSGFDASLCKKIPVAERATLVNAVAQVVKKYAMSSTFTDDYNKRIKEDYSSNTKPVFTDQEWQDKLQEKQTSATQLLAMLDDATLKNMFDGAYAMGKMIDDAFESKDEARIAAFTGIGLSAEHAKKDMQELNSLKALFTSDKKAFKTKYALHMANADVMGQFNSELKSYENSMNEMNTKLAMNKNDHLKMLLQNFLEASANVDFEAKLLPADQSGNHKFANPDYEEKSNDWKAYYRAGKAPVTAARTFAQQWLKELN